MARLSEKGKPPATAGRKTTDLEPSFQTAGLPKGAKAMTISVVTNIKHSVTGTADFVTHGVSRQVGALKALTKPISSPDLARDIRQAIGFSG